MPCLYLPHAAATPATVKEDWPKAPPSDLPALSQDELIAKAQQLFAAMPPELINEATLTLMARIACICGDSHAALELGRRAASIKPKLRAFQPALLAFSLAADDASAVQLEAEIGKLGLELTGEVLIMQS